MELSILLTDHYNVYVNLPTAFFHFLPGSHEFFIMKILQILWTNLKLSYNASRVPPAESPPGKIFKDIIGTIFGSC
jgi:hypothetical protein